MAERADNDQPGDLYTVETPGYGVDAPQRYHPGPKQTGYPTQQTDHPLQQSGYPQQQPGYPPHQPGYPPQQPGYPPHQPGYPPQQPGYLLQQPGYLLQQTGFVQLPYTNTNTAVVVNQPLAGTAIVQPRTPDYMVSSILACLCCFWPTGICAIYYANEANNLAGVGDYEGSRRMSDNARKLVITSVILGIIAITLSVVLRIVLFKNKCEY
ncbi:proline-rich transmembrane protein 1-like isoform X2 [Mercenaria mercenaria]|uniref:proline-rich transmembrane protein 1-like isoform X2 n=1 Tax=Mercenaria mercenaria TaxID=6596 RepID=UPI00234F77EE|nr:proline-rich transmembrane protein 1-like isoform X2 [Mercenaria mercenaria]